MTRRAAALALAVALALALAGCDLVGDVLAPPELPRIDVSLDGFELTAEEVDDGAPNSGEAVVFDGFLTNRADSAYASLRLTVEHASEVVRAEVDRRTSSFGSIEPGGRRRFTVEAELGPDLPAGTPVRLGVRLAHSSGAEAVLPIDLVVGPLPYALSLGSWAVVADADMDGLVARGEDRAEVELTFAFDVPTLCVAYEVSTAVPEVTFLSAPGSHSCYSQATRSARVAFRVASTLDAGEIPFEVALTDRLGNTGRFPTAVGVE